MAATVKDIIDRISGKLVSGENLDVEISGCYVSDLLSDVLANSEEGQVWITHHTHTNVVAVAAVKGLAAVVVVASGNMETDALKRAESEGVTVISSPLEAFAASGIIYAVLNS